MSVLERSQNEIAQAIIDLEPGAEALVEEWFAVLTRVHRDADRQLAGAVKALRDLVEAGEGVTETRNYDAAVRWRKAQDAAIGALPSPSKEAR